MPSYIDSCQLQAEQLHSKLQFSLCFESFSHCVKTETNKGS